jgi:hypothetical protein
MDTLDVIVYKGLSVLSGLIGLGWIGSMVYHWDNVAHRLLSVGVIGMALSASYLLWKLKD